MRGLSVRANFVSAVAAKVATMATAVLSVPVLLQLLGPRQYGVWATLTSLLAFVTLLDLGVGNGIRNSVAARSGQDLAPVHDEFIGFFRLLAGVGVAAVAALLALKDFSQILAQHWLQAVLLYVPMLLAVPLLLGNGVLQGARLTGAQAALQASTGLLFFGAAAACLALHTVPSLTQLALLWAFLQAATLAGVFALALRVLRLAPGRLLTARGPRVQRGRLAIGLQFLALQLASLVLYGLGNALIYRSLGPEQVARYDTLNKVFQVGMSLFALMIGIMWSEIAGHRARRDAAALRRSYGQLLALALAFAAACGAAAFWVPAVVAAWTGGKVALSTGECLAAAALTSAQAIAYAGAVVMNAFERLRLQVALAFCSIGLMVPLSQWLFDRGHGIAAVPVAACLLTLLPMVACNVQAVRLIASVRPQAVPA